MRGVRNGRMKIEHLQGFSAIKCTSGIYMLTNLKNNKVYIGQSSNIKQRLYTHFHQGKSQSIHNHEFHNDIEKFGAGNFKVEILEECFGDTLFEREVYWINRFDAVNKGYNQMKGGRCIPPNTQSPQSIQKRVATFMEDNKHAGEHHGRALLSESEVVRIRQRYINGESVEEIYKDFPQYRSQDAFACVVFGKSYKYVGNIPTQAQVRQHMREQMGRIPFSVVRKIREDFLAGIKRDCIANKYDIPSYTVNKICRNVIYIDRAYPELGEQCSRKISSRRENG